MTNQPTSDMTTNSVAGVVAVGPSINTSLGNTHSLLSSSIYQIAQGDFVLHGSDVTTIVGSVFLIGNFILAYRRHRKETQDR